MAISFPAESPEGLQESTVEAPSTEGNIFAKAQRSWEKAPASQFSSHETHALKQQLLTDNPQWKGTSQEKQLSR